MHYNSKSVEAKGAICYFHYHNDTHFGLGKNDACKILGRKRSDWIEPDKDDILANEIHVRTVLEEANLL